MKTHNVSAEAKTGENLLKLVVADILWAQLMFGLFIIALCSDDGGDARKMRRLLLDSMPWLIIVVCWAHQINLIVGDYLGLKIPLLDCVPKALAVVKWTNSHSRALGLFNSEQLTTPPNRSILALILPVITRWTAHYLSLRRLLDVEIPMRAVWLKCRQGLIDSAGRKAEAVEKAKKIEAIVIDPLFWSKVKV